MDTELVTGRGCKTEESQNKNPLESMIPKGFQKFVDYSVDPERFELSIRFPVYTLSPEISGCSFKLKKIKAVFLRQPLLIFYCGDGERKVELLGGGF